MPGSAWCTHKTGGVNNFTQELPCSHCIVRNQHAVWVRWNREGCPLFHIVSSSKPLLQRAQTSTSRSRLQFCSWLLPCKHVHILVISWASATFTLPCVWNVPRSCLRQAPTHRFGLSHARKCCCKEPGGSRRFLQVQKLSSQQDSCKSKPPAPNTGPRRVFSVPEDVVDALESDLVEDVDGPVEVFSIQKSSKVVQKSGVKIW